MTPEQEIAAHKRLVAAARAILSQEAGFPLGAQRMTRVLRDLGPFYERRYSVFKEFHDAIPGIVPLGQSRLRWDIAELIRQEAALHEVEGRYRARLIQACAEIIEQELTKT
jgi:hypothetical protein